MGIQTKSFYQNTSNNISRSEEDLKDLGYWVAIPWNEVYSTGWLNYQTDFNTPIRMWGDENKMILTDQPEYFTSDGYLRSTGGIPTINTNNPEFEFDRTKAVYRVF